MLQYRLFRLTFCRWFFVQVPQGILWSGFGMTQSTRVMEVLIQLIFPLPQKVYHFHHPGYLYQYSTNLPNSDLLLLPYYYPPLYFLPN